MTDLDWGIFLILFLYWVKFFHDTWEHDWPRERWGGVMIHRLGIVTALALLWQLFVWIRRSLRGPDDPREALWIALIGDGSCDAFFVFFSCGAIGLLLSLMNTRLQARPPGNP